MRYRDRAKERLDGQEFENDEFGFLDGNNQPKIETIDTPAVPADINALRQEMAQIR
jgi:hypothetical protein